MSEENLLIVDGQQRLTSLYAVMKKKEILRDDYSKGFIEIAFQPMTESFEVADAAICRDKNWIPNISKLWSKETDLFELVDSYLETLRQSREVTQDDTKQIRRAIQKLYGLKNYPFRALELLSTVDEEQVSQIFVRINSKGQRLNEADFILTLMSVYWNEGRHSLESFARAAKHPSERVTPYNHFIKPSPDQLLRVAVGYGFRRGRLKHVYSLLRGKDLDTGEFNEERRIAQFERLKRAQADTTNLKISALLDPATDAYRNAIERHHLFPKEWLKTNGYLQISQTNQVANYAMVEWPDNNDISYQSPAVYWPQYKDRYSKEDWKDALYWHALPESWATMQYEDFLMARRGMIAQVIKDGFAKI